jgi:hypothetical protein
MFTSESSLDITTPEAIARRPKATRNGSVSAGTSPTLPSPCAAACTYCTGYLGDIGVPRDPAPMDFSAWFEVFLVIVGTVLTHATINPVLVAFSSPAVAMPLTSLFCQAGTNQLARLQSVSAVAKCLNGYGLHSCKRVLHTVIQFVEQQFLTFIVMFAVRNIDAYGGDTLDVA